MEAFMKKDVLTIFNVSQAFNPQVNMLIMIFKNYSKVPIKRPGLKFSQKSLLNNQ